MDVGQCVSAAQFCACINKAVH